MYGKLSFIRRLSQLGTILKTRMLGVQVGEDPVGNRYFRTRYKKGESREERWVMYKEEPEPSLIPPEWYGWLHHTCDHPLQSEAENRYVWQKPHQPNLSGTGVAPLPTGHPLASFDANHRGRAQGSYQAWMPSE
jgi:NADH:ubiquinone oxidoreductase subunit